jgi:hypothetical protein
VSNRLKSSFWVQALLRTCETRGLFGAVLTKGAEEAGAVFVVINHLNGEHTLLGPPPGPSHDDEGTRLFIRESKVKLSWDDVREKMARKQRSDTDLWLVEIEDREGLAGIVPLDEKDA